MTRQEFNALHPTGEQLTMIHYDFETKERTAQPAVIVGTKQKPDDKDEFLVRVRFTQKKQTCEMDPTTFGILSNIENLKN